MGKQIKKSTLKVDNEAISIAGYQERKRIHSFVDQKIHWT